MFYSALREYEAVAAETTLADGSTLAAIDVRRFDWIRRLAGDYAFDFAKIASLYAGDPASRQAWTDAIARTRGMTRPNAAVASLLAAQQERRGAPPAAREAAQKLVDPKTVAIVTGQQAGAFGGPLFTLLKAITAIQLARKTSREHQANVIAIFWVDAEDHDWQEVASWTVLDASFQPHAITLPKPEGAEERSVAALILDERVEHSLDELATMLGETEFSDWLMTALRGVYRPGTGMAEAFAKWIEAILGPHGLVVYDSSDPSAKPLVAELFAHELEAGGRTAALAKSAGDALAAHGHQPQVVPQPDSVALFHLDGARRPIRRQGDQFAVGDSTFAVDVLASRRAPRRTFSVRTFC